MDPSSRDVQALVLTPTRELALQVSEAIETMAKHLPQVRVLAVYGGASFVPQLKALSSGVQVVVGTPGRIIDHLDRGTLKLGNLKFLVLDEADEMLRMGFAEDVENILTNAPKTGRQTALFSRDHAAADQAGRRPAHDRPDRHRRQPAVLDRRERPADLRGDPVQPQDRCAGPDHRDQLGRRHHRLHPYQGRRRERRLRADRPRHLRRDDQR